MRDMMNVAFQSSWFGPFQLPNVYVGNPPEELPAGTVYNDGPLDGLKTTSMWAQQFAQIPLQSAFQAQLAGARPKKVALGAAPVFCPPGQMPVSTGVPGESKCIAWSPPSGMMAKADRSNRTFPVKPFFGWKES